MPVDATTNGSPPAVARLGQTGFFVGASDIPAGAVEHPLVLVGHTEPTTRYTLRCERRTAGVVELLVDRAS